MSSARGAAGAVKPKLHNVNSIYAGKNQNAVKAPGSGKHGGLQSLGKTTAVVRRMPPPATLPSLRAESQGQDPNVALVPQGGTGWHKENAAANAQSSDPSGKSVGQAGSALSGSAGCAVASGAGPHGTDLRPTWAKQPSSADMAAQSQLSASAVAASARDFPSLAAATAASSKQPAQTLTDSLKPQKSGSWRAGGSSAVSKNDGDEPIPPPQMHSSGGYPPVTAPVRNIERQLPSRYYDASAAPPPPPTGSFQIPKQSSAAHATPSQPATPVAKEDSRPQIQEGGASQSSLSPVSVSAASVQEANSTTFSSNLAVPPINYSQPPPNFQLMQLPSRYYDASAAPPPPPTGSFQIPKQSSAAHATPSQPATPVAKEDSRPQIQEGGASQSSLSPVSVSAASVQEANSTTFSSNLAVPPINYSQPPPNFQLMQQQAPQLRGSASAQSMLNDVALARCEQEGATAPQKDGLGDGGYPPRTQNTMFDETHGGPVGAHSTNAIQQMGQMNRSSDVRNMPYGRRESFESRDMGFEEASMRGAECDWRGSQQYRGMDREPARHWASMGSSPQDVRHLIDNVPQNAYGRERDEERQDLEREAAIERSRQKRRVAGGSLSQPDGEGRPSGYGSLLDDSTMCRQEKAQPRQRWATRQDDYGDSMRSGMRREDVESAPKPEYRMLRRPESKESVELPQQLSQMIIGDGIQDEEDDELQLTKLSRPAAKVIKRVAPGTGTTQVTQMESVPVNAVQSIPTPQNSQPSSRSSPSLHHQRVAPQNGPSDKRMPEHRNQRAIFRGRNTQSARAARLQEESGALQGRELSQPINPALAVAPPPTDNVWEKRAEERESAERERAAAQRDALHQMRLQQQFPPVGELPTGIGGYVNDINGRDDGMNANMGREGAMKNDGMIPRQRSNRHRNQNWTDGGYGGGQAYSQQEGNDYYGQEDEEYNGVLFRGQREFVNSRVSGHHRSARGISLGGARGGRGYMRGAYSGMRRGSSMPHQLVGQHGHRQQTTHYNERNQRRSKRHDEQPLEEEDNFANMGEFHVEDTYECMGAPVQMAQQKHDENSPEGEEDYEKTTTANGGDHRGPRQTRSQRASNGGHRNAQQLYQPRQQLQDEYGGRVTGRGGRVGGSSRGGSARRSDARNALAANQNPPERGKRKKEMSIREEEIGRELREEESAMKVTQNPRGENYRRGGGGRRGSQQQQMRHRRGAQSPSTHQNAAQMTTGGSGAERGGQLKSPVTSEGHEEWATASESSDVADKQRTSKRRVVAASKYGGSGNGGQRRMPRSNNNAQRREQTNSTNNATGNAQPRAGMSSKNAKPASTTSHAAARGVAQPQAPLKDETGPVGLGPRGEGAAKREACKDGLAGVDINNAGVIVIDDRPDEQHGDDSIDNGDFEEVLSKKSKRLRQQQINEQLEAANLVFALVIWNVLFEEERRKLKEKEKQEKRRAKMQSKKADKKTGNAKEERNVANCDANLVNGTVSEASLKVGNCNNAVPRPKAETSQGNAQNTLNTTVWNSNIVKEHTVRQSSPPLENHPVIPSPIARPTPKTSVASTAPSAAVKKGVEVWAGPDDEQRLTTSKKSTFGKVETCRSHPVIPSPIARPTPKTSVASTAPSAAVKKGVEVWAGPDDEQRLTTSKKLDEAASSAKKNSVEFAASFNSPSSRTESAQYDFTFDPSLQDESQPLPVKGKPTSANADKTTTSGSASAGRAPAPAPPSRSPPLAGSTLDANDLKQRLDKVKDFWPGQQQFSNSLLVNASENGSIAPLVNDKSSTNASAPTSSLSHAPNVAKVRPQPQTNEQSTTAPLKEAASCASSAPSLPPPSPIACVPPGAYLQSLSQVPPPAALTHYSMIFGEPYNPHSTTSSPAQTLFGTGVSVSQAPASRSRPGSFIEQSQLFIHPPPSGTAPSSLTWSNGNPQIELLAGINATPPLPSQPGNPVQRFQFSSQPRSGSAFSARPALLNGNGKLLGAPPPPHPHQMPPPLHPPNFIAPPPDFISLPGTALGAVGSQRSSELASQSSASNALSRSAVGVLGQLPPPHLQQQLNFPAQSQSGFTITATGSFSQAPPMHAFTAPPPPLRYPPVVPTLTNDATGVLAAGWTTKPSVNAFPLKYTNGGAQAPTPIGASSGRSAPPPTDRWAAVPVSVPPQYANALVFQSTVAGKESADTLQSNIERFPSSQRCASAPRASSADENARASSESSVTASAGGDTIDNSNQQKKATKLEPLPATMSIMQILADPDRPSYRSILSAYRFDLHRAKFMLISRMCRDTRLCTWIALLH
ncbi:Protein PRRC2A [Toxocara canis]|uniref:Protein PRRC2A n=1 Tax=Toxocara canis TaxID=6265 RepID=A0A0B2VSG6_TOXCA|nr:Protein PRRC2A [Toxocara canis]